MRKLTAALHRRVAPLGLALAAVLLTSAPGASAAPTLKIGDPAPLLQPAKWLKGAAIPKFQPGHVYVVEFWATWCGACKAAMPHLTELARKYQGKAEIIGVDISETSQPAAQRLQKAAAFVRSQGSNMDYHVAADGLDNHIMNDWIIASQESGIPVAFVIGKDGRIAWIGHPSEGLGKALPQIIGGQFDIKAAAKRHDQQYGAENAIMAAWGSKSYSKVVDLVNAEIAKDPNNLDAYASTYFTALPHVSASELEKQARAYLALKNGSWETYQKLCTFLIIAQGCPPDVYRFGLTLVNEALQFKERRPSFLFLGAELAMNLGDHAEAIRMQTEGIAAAEQDPLYTPDQLATHRADLEKYKAAAGS